MRVCLWCSNDFIYGLLLNFSYSDFLVSTQSHAGKVVERHWYEKNKHIFPASRWEVLTLPVSCVRIAKRNLPSLLA